MGVVNITVAGESDEKKKGGGERGKHNQRE